MSMSEEMNTSLMVGLTLSEVWMSPRVQVHPAWRDETTAAICTHIVVLSCAGSFWISVLHAAE